VGQLSRRFGALLAAICLFAAPLVAQIAYVTQLGAAVAGWLIAGQAGLVGWFAAAWIAGNRGGARISLARAATSLVIAGLTLVLWRRTDAGLVLAAATPHGVAYLGLVAVFAGSLAPGRTAVITRVAQHVRGVLSDELLRYTRNVTRAWCGFFGAQLIGSLLLGLFAPLLWWSVFINLCNLPLVFVMFSAEIAYRHRYYGIHNPDPSTGRFARLLQVTGQLASPVRQAKT
jgi:uncharacterized membrane protein